MSLKPDIFSGPLSVSEIKKKIDNRDDIFWVALDDNNVIGYAQLTPRKDSYYLQAMLVLKAYRNKQIGTDLLRWAGEYVDNRPLYLEVAPFNKLAQEFYSKQGFSFSDAYPATTSRYASGAKIHWIVMAKNTG